MASQLFALGVFLSALCAVRGFAEQARITLSYEQIGNRTYFTGETNLPDGTKMKINLRPPGRTSGPQGSVVVHSGSFRSDGFSTRGIPIEGEWEVELLCHFTRFWQTPSVLQLLDEYGGEHVTRGKNSIGEGYYGRSS